MSTKAKALTIKKVTEKRDQNELKDLRQQIESLAMILKSATVVNNKPKMGGGVSSLGKRKSLVILLRNPFKGHLETVRVL